MDKVQRFEVITLDHKGAIRLDNGMLKAPLTLSRVGVFPYRNADGSTRRELRLPEEVFNADAMASFELVPFLDEHPYSEGGAVTAENAKRLQVGAVGGVHKAGQNLDGTVMVTADETVGKVLSGKVAVSCGYFCQREMAPGVWLDSDGTSHPYDCIQRNIRGNHVALVQAGRAGPEARIRLDSQDAILLSETNQPKEEMKPMEKITLDGIPCEVPAQSAAIIAKAINTRDSQLTELKAAGATKDAAIAKMTSDTEKLSATLDALKSELKAEQDPAKFNAAVAERVALTAKAATVLGSDFKMDGLDAKAIKSAVVAKLNPELKCDGKSDDYVNALFDHLTASTHKVNPATQTVAAEIRDGKVVVTDSTEVIDPFKKMMDEFNNPQPKAKQ